MDRFESEIKRLESLRPEELERWMREMTQLCRCPDCATYTECNADNREMRSRGDGTCQVSRRSRAGNDDLDTS